MANRIPLEYKIDVNVGDTKDITGRLRKSLQSADKSADELASSLKNIGANATISGRQLNNSAPRVNTYTKATDKAAKSNRSLQSSTRASQTTLTNFGRVVSDSPYGMIGIANNIDPLLESFQRLRTQTGGARSAFKSLAASLAGPAGIAIAVSALTSIIVAFGPKIKEFFTGPVRDAVGISKDYANELISINEELAKLDGGITPETIEKNLDIIRNEIKFVEGADKRLAATQSAISQIANNGLEVPASLITQLNEQLNQVAAQEKDLEELRERQAEAERKLRLERRLSTSAAVQDAKVRKTELEEIAKFRENIENLPKLDLFQVEDEGVEAPEFDFNINQDAVQRAKSETEALWQFRLATADEFGRKELQIAAKYQKLKDDLAQSGQLTEERLNQLEVQKEKETTEAKKKLKEQEATFTIRKAQLMADGVIGVSRLLFGESKALAVASAIVDGAAAITKTFKEYGFTPFGVAAAVGMAANTAAQIKTILSTKPGGGGSAPKAKAGGGGGGSQSRAQQGFSTQDTQSFADERRNRRQNVNIYVENKLDKKGLSIAAKQGQQQTVSEATIINSDG